MITDQVTENTCTDAADFTSDENFTTILLSRIPVNFPRFPMLTPCMETSSLIRPNKLIVKPWPSIRTLTLEIPRILRQR